MPDLGGRGHPLPVRAQELIAYREIDKRRQDAIRVEPHRGSADAAEDRKRFEQPEGEGGELAPDHGDAHEDHDAGCDDLEHAPDAPDGLEPGGKGVGEHGGEQKGTPSPSE